MKTLKLSDSEARALHKTASPELKAVLESEENFGKDFFSQKVTDRIKSYLDACQELGIVPLSESALQDNGFSKDEIAYRKIKTITEALNEGWKPNWNDSNQKKWTPWFNTSHSSGFVFDSTGYGCSYASAGNGLRLCFKSDELAAYAGKQFTEIYNDFIL